MRVHLIAIGGAVMHNLALALQQKGYQVSGSDDEIFDPAKSRLEKAGILPDRWGWFPEKLDSKIDVIILGMHARADNPELLRAQELGLKIFSFPEFLYENTRNKTRIVIGGSHGKTTTTSMIMHIFRFAGLSFDYMVGAQIEGFERMVEFNEDSEIAIFEGDEYLSSPIDRRPKFHLYHPHIAVLTGIAWDHINVFPQFENYVEQFKIFSDLIQPNGHLIYFEQDIHLKPIAQSVRADIHLHPYGTHPHHIQDEITSLVDPAGKKYPLQVFGKHNLQNIQAAYEVCKLSGISDELFYEAMSHFGGAAKRLQLLKKSDDSAVFLDFAHSPSKLKATVTAVREQFPSRKLIACMELHTFSSLNADFLKEYNGCMDAAHEAIVFYDHHVLVHKKMPDLLPEQVKSAFGGNVTILTDARDFRNYVENLSLHDTNLLLMSSGNFSGIQFRDLANQLIP
jgi:UDP-N-acetylmuramate: L-alanyl-gamma-D-glutamyl-meso-diaminopimelate ligase